MEEDSGDVTAECDMWEDVGLHPHPSPSSKLTAPAGPQAGYPAGTEKEMACKRAETQSQGERRPGLVGKHSVFSKATEKVNQDLNPKSGTGFLRAVS